MKYNFIQLHRNIFMNWILYYVNMKYNKPDVLKWTKNVKGGVYVPKLGYLAIRSEEGIDPTWRCHTIWKINCLLKIQLLSLVAHGRKGANLGHLGS